MLHLQLESCSVAIVRCSLTPITGLTWTRDDHPTILSKGFEVLTDTHHWSYLDSDEHPNILSKVFEVLTLQRLIEALVGHVHLLWGRGGLYSPAPSTSMVMFLLHVVPPLPLPVVVLVPRALVLVSFMPTTLPPVLLLSPFPPLLILVLPPLAAHAAVF
eukprot:4898411-Pyramimonas_sp.AAC.1